jgi:osmotically inducible lipoprotein OsmB
MKTVLFALMMTGLLTACTTLEQRVSGAAAGAGTGALVGGPVGAVAGGAVGAVAAPTVVRGAKRL